MHKTLYIDIDEEITSIIDRVRKAEAREVIIIAPKNSLVLQGIVNLRLLKKEADRQKKQLLIVTQDKFGKKMIEKAGILVQTRVENDIFLEEEADEEEYQPIHADEALAIKEELQKEEQFGSSDYFDEKVEFIPDQSIDLAAKKKEKIFSQKPAKKSAVPRKAEAKNKVSMSDIVVSLSPSKRKKTKSKTIKKEEDPEIIIKEEDSFADRYSGVNSEPPKISQVSIKKAEKFFRSKKQIKKNLEVAKVGGGVKKFFLFFSLIVLLLAASAVTYFFLPKATLTLYAKNPKKTVVLDLTASSEVSLPNLESKMLPAKFEQVEKDFSQDFEATGTAKGGSRAGGKVVIYNEYSPEDQPLVATTRLTAPDGKIFRITKNIVVPGTTKVGGETKPGAVEAEVTADQPGENYNIDPADFKIAGFKGTPEKYEKFYAKSSGAMTGGSAGDGKAVTAQDIAAAKEKIAANIKENSIDEFRKSLPSVQKTLDNSVQMEIVSVSVSDNAGSQKEKFSAVAKVRFSFLSFQETDIKDLMRKNLIDSGENSSEILFNRSIEYSSSNVDFQKKMILFKAKSEVAIAPKINTENFRKGVLGKKSYEAQDYVNNFKNIEKMDTSLWPFFIRRIPINENRIDIKLQEIDL